MRRLVPALLAAVLALAVSGSLLPASAAAPAPARRRGGLATLRRSLPKVRISKVSARAATARTVPGELIVTYDRNTSPADRRASVADAQVGPGDVETLAPRVALVDLGPDASARDEARVTDALEASDAVEAVEPNVARPPLFDQNDPRFDDLWGLRNIGQSHPIADPPPSSVSGAADADIDADTAWDTQTGTSGTVIAVIDNGVDLGHPDLNGSLWTNAAEASGSPGVDDDGNGYVDDVNGYDFKNGDADPSPSASGDAAGHGTHVAGTIGAAMDNGVGVAGVCPGCRIMVLKFGYDVASEIEAIQYAIDNGADVINASYGGGVWSAAERARIEDAGAAGILFVAAAGNGFADNDNFMAGRNAVYSPLFPATYTLPNIVSVAASNHKDDYAYSTGCARRYSKWRCQFSNFGQESVDLAAPGVDITSTWPTADGSYETISGTSMSAPHVSGVAGLVWSENPGYSPEDVKNAIMNSTDRPPSLDKIYVQGGYISGPMTQTTGRANANAALTGSTVDGSLSTDGQIQGAVGIRRSRRGRVGWPADVNDVFRKRLKSNKRYRATLRFGRRDDLDLWIWKPGTVEILQLQNGCYHRNGSCPVVSFHGVTLRNPETVTFRARKTDVYFFQVASFVSRSNYRLTIKRVR